MNYEEIKKLEGRQVCLVLDVEKVTYLEIESVQLINGGEVMFAFESDEDIDLHLIPVSASVAEKFKREKIAVLQKQIDELQGK